MTSSCVTAPQSAGNADSEVPSPRAFAKVALGQTDRAVVLAGRHVQHHQVERPLEQAGCHPVAPANSPSSPLCAAPVTNPWPGHLHLNEPTVVADLAMCPAPAITSTVPMAAMSGPETRSWRPSSIISAKASTPARRQNRSTLRWTASIARVGIQGAAAGKEFEGSPNPGARLQESDTGRLEPRYERDRAAATLCEASLRGLLVKEFGCRSLRLISAARRSLDWLQESRHLWRQVAAFQHRPGQSTSARRYYHDSFAMRKKFSRCSLQTENSNSVCIPR